MRSSRLGDKTIYVGASELRPRAGGRSKFDRAQTVASPPKKTMNGVSAPGTCRCDGRWIPACGCVARLTRPRPFPRKLPPRGPGRVSSYLGASNAEKMSKCSTGPSSLPQRVSLLPDRPAPQISPMPVGPLLSNNSRNRLQLRTYLRARLRIRIQPPIRRRHRWFLQTVQVPPPNSGMADSLDEAKAAFAKRYAEVKKAR
jgi:hypothetical protein